MSSTRRFPQPLFPTTFCRYTPSVHPHWGPLTRPQETFRLCVLLPVYTVEDGHPSSHLCVILYLWAGFGLTSEELFRVSWGVGTRLLWPTDLGSESLLKIFMGFLVFGGRWDGTIFGRTLSCLYSTLCGSPILTFYVVVGFLMFFFWGVGFRVCRRVVLNLIWLFY